MGKLFVAEKFKPIDLSAETKATVKDLIGLYKISSFGRVLNVKTGKEVRPYKNNNGYLCVAVRGRSKTEYRVPVHYLVADAFLKNPNKRFYSSINHKDENKLNANYENLEWCTQEYNTRYSMHKRCKLSEEDICEISKYLDIIPLLTPAEKVVWNEIQEPTSIKKLSEKYDVPVSTIQAIKKRKGYYGWVLYNNYNNLSLSKEILGIDRANKIIEQLFDVHWLDGKVPFMEK